MKKVRFAVMAALASLLAIGFMGCPQPSTPTSSTLQEQIDNAPAGGTVILDASLASAGASITINKALTVNGSNIEGLNVTVTANAANSVTLKNFKDAKIDVASGAGRSAARGIAFGNGNAKSFKKFGDGAASLNLEGCTVKEFSTVADLALFMGSGENKSIIDSLLLKKGAEDFTFVEYDEKDTATAEKSEVKDLKIEDGVKEINLIGGTFGDVDFTDDFTGEIDFKYDREFEDQLNFEERDAFLVSDKIDAKDIALAEDALVDEHDSSIYRFTMSKDDFENLNGKMDIVFLTKTQAEAWKQHASGASMGNIDYSEFITFETPAYDMSIMGPFTVEKNDDGEVADGLYAVYGGSKTYRKYKDSFFHEYNVITLEKYLTYSKEAVIVEVKGDEVNVYVNKGAVRKSDLLMCSGWKSSDADPDQATGTCEGGSKLSNIDLEGYYPYFAINTESGFMEGQSQNLFANYSYTALNNYPMCMPVSSKQDFPQVYILYEVADYNEYPDVSEVEYPDVQVPSQRVTVKYYDKALNYVSSTSNVIRENLNPAEDGYEYYFDDQFTKMITTADPNGNMSEYEWEAIYDEQGYKVGDEVIIYARPERNIEFECINFFGGLEFSHLYQVSFDEYRVFKNYDSANEKFSGEITGYKDIEDGSTIYVVVPYVHVYSIGTDEELEPIEIGKMDLTMCYYENWESHEVVLSAPFYKTASAQDSNKYTVEELKAVDVATKVYSTYPLVRISESADVYEENPEEMSFVDFYALVTGAANSQKFYHQEMENDENGFTQLKYVECTKDTLDAWLESGQFALQSIYFVVKALPDTTKINVVDLNAENQTPTEMFKKELLGMIDSLYKYSTFYSDSGKQTILTADDLAALEDGATIYVYSDTIKIYKYHASGFLDYEDMTVSKASFPDYRDYTYYKKYKDKAMETELTDALFAALEDGAAIYLYSPYVKVCYEYTDSESGMLMWGSPMSDQQTVADILSRYYPEDEWPQPMGKVYKTQDKTEEYTREEILALEADAVLYLEMN